MKPAPFRLERPTTLAQALDLLAEAAGSARLLAGGQSLVPRLNARLEAPAVLIDLERVAELGGFRLEGDAGKGEALVVGAMCRQAELLRAAPVASRLPLLHAALAAIGHAATRSRGTIGGSLAFADPPAELPLAAVALDARLRLAGPAGERTVAASAFFLGAQRTVLGREEILLDVTFPLPPANARFDFRETGRRTRDRALVGVAIQEAMEGLVVAVSGLEERPLRLHHAAALARGDDAGAITEAIARDLAGTAPMDDLHAGAAYRRSLAEALLWDALTEVLRP